MKKDPNQRKMITCRNCNQLQEHHAKGYCDKCYKNVYWKQTKIITCANCGRQKYHKAHGLCGTCHVKLFHYDNTKAYNYRKYHNISLELYRKITKKCALCGFDKIVELHHIDRNHKNSAEKNLLGLCPNHHKMAHNIKYSDDVEDLILKYLKKNSPLDSSLNLEEFKIFD